VAAVCYLLSLGRYCEPVYRVVFALPFGDLIRCPVKWHHLTEFALVVLAAFGVEGLLPLVGRFRRGWLRPEILLGAPLLFGVVDLVREDRRYCAPVDVSEARRRGMESQLTILQRAHFQDPQVAAMVKQGLIRSVARYLGHPDVYVVQVLKPFSPDAPRPLSAGTLALGVLSVVTVLGGLAFAVVDIRRNG